MALLLAAFGLLRAAGQWTYEGVRKEFGIQRWYKRGSVIGGSSFRNLDINLDCNYVALESL